MKKLGITILLFAIILQAFSQELSADNKDNNSQAKDTIVKDTISNDETTKVVIGNDLITVEESNKSFDFRVKDRGLSILESLEGPKLKFKKYSEVNDWEKEDPEEDDSDVSWQSDDSEKNISSERRHFKGHWAGIELGLNNYLTDDKSDVMPDDIDYMTLHSSKSSNFNLNFTQLSLGLTRHIGFVTGLGLTWNNYRFDGDNNIIKGANGIIENLPADSGTYFKKSKLATLYLDLPFLFEVQIPVSRNHLNIAFGPIAAAKISSHNKIVFPNDKKIKSHGDFSLNMLRYGATARIGYENLQIYSTYYMTPLFKEGKGPGGYDLYPFEIGLAFTFFD